MALVNPQIAMSYRPTVEYQPRNALAEYAQIQQIMGGQRQAELAQYQLEAARRADQSASIQNELYARHFDPETGAINVAAFAAEAAKRGQGGILPGFFKTEAERQTAAQALRKSKVETETAEFGLQQKKFRQAWENAGAADTPQLAIEQLTKAVRNGEIDMTSASQQINQLQNMQPDQYRQWRISKIAQFLDAKDRVAMMQPKIARQESGGEIVSFQDNPALPGYGLPAAGIPRIVKTATIGETTAQGQLGVSQGQLAVSQQRLAFDKQKLEWEQANPGNTIQQLDDGRMVAINNRTGVAKPVTMGELNAPVKGSTIAERRLAFDQQKFAYERANPGYELKESGDGTIYAVNKKTLQATPVTIGAGPNALAPAPGAANALVPGAAPGAAPAAAPSAPTPAVSAAPGAVTSGTPLKGKGKELAVTEQQASYNVGRILDAAKEINAVVQKDPDAFKPGALEAVSSSMGAAGAANAARNAQRQIVYGAQRDALDAMLYLATGAAYNREQLEGQMAAYMPAYTDKPEAVDAKRARMLGLIQNAKVRAGKAWTPELEKSLSVLMQPSSAANVPVAPKVGEVREGYRFKGGNPADQKNWEKQ